MARTIDAAVAESGMEPQSSIPDRDHIVVSRAGYEVDTSGEHWHTFLDSVERVLDEIRTFVARKSPGARMALLSRKRAQLIPYQILLAREDTGLT